jgi:hypothetical protein
MTQMLPFMGAFKFIECGSTGTFLFFFLKCKRKTKQATLNLKVVDDSVILARAILARPVLRFMYYQLFFFRCIGA